ncbi:DUF72 domain-containing protein [Paractinoplanes rhizophilus]|uniref:DUF72 domain-containing protein n=1 Tax=Paractinoplanes rhizophilus TaxID=1416877 RepID=A0ABW2HSG1_9ACTN
MVGTSGWQYRDWKGRLYPEKLPQRLWLEHFAERFRTVEVNNAFYRLPERKTFEQWRARTPDDFVVAVKMSRYLTHVKRLREPAEPVQRFLDRAHGLGDKLGPVLIQLPPTLPGDPALLEETLSRFPAATKVVVEPRHPTWFTDETRAVLEKHRAALCWADRKGRPTGPLWRTADWAYIRMHEGQARPWPHYGKAALRKWLELAGQCDETYVYFNNDPGGAAVTDATEMIAMARRRGVEVSRSPADR